ncbi:hypothetical protein ACTVKR_23895 [Serratia bockelmannii]|uniref:hypothetical protein n=1 Tax=Serratia bockelmannii TaxID=2703793 RepID=UPI003FA6AD10
MADSIDVTTLKSAFKEGATPNQEDYAQLIDLAAVGSRALGTIDKDRPRDGLTLDKEYRLSVKSGKGVTVDDKGVAVQVDGNTIIATEDGLAIAIAKDKGLDTSDKGLCIRTGPGLKVGGAGLEIDCADNGGLSTLGGGLRVVLGNASVLYLDKDNKLNINLNKKTPGYIELTNGGLAITQDSVQKIEKAFEEGSINALKEAALGTIKGSKKIIDADIKNAVDVSLVKEISQELNNAYGKGYQTRREEELAVTVTSPDNVPATPGGKVNLATYTQVTPGKTVYFIPGSTKPEQWNNIVGSLDSSGTLSLKNNARGEISVLVLVVSYDDKGPHIAAKEVKVVVSDPPVSEGKK